MKCSRIVTAREKCQDERAKACPGAIPSRLPVGFAFTPRSMQGGWVGSYWDVLAKLDI